MSLYRLSHPGALPAFNGSPQPTPLTASGLTLKHTGMLYMAGDLGSQCWRQKNQDQGENMRGTLRKGL